MNNNGQGNGVHWLTYISQSSVSGLSVVTSAEPDGIVSVNRLLERGDEGLGAGEATRCAWYKVSTLF